MKRNTIRMGVIIMALAVTGVAISGDLPTPDQLPLKAELPDPLAMFEKGAKVTTKEQWEKRRRPELKHLFEHYMYGKAPKAPKVNAKVERIDKNALGGKATLKEITLTFAGIDGPKIHVLLVVPNKKGPHPVFVGMNFCGNHAVLNDPKITLNPNWMYGNRKGVKDNKATEQARGTDVEVWNIEDIIDRGYAIATFYSGDIDPDRADERGIQKYFGNEFDWSTIRAWAWGYSRVIDYLETLEDEIDTKRIIVVGHSRLGKTALLCCAFGERVALCIPHQAGCGGSGPSRPAVGNKGAESVKRINTSFPHWFNKRFKDFNEEPERLPFDQHCLIALCAPAPVLLSNAVDDKWANPDGQFALLVAADPVYKLMGSKGIAAKNMPAVGKLMDSPLGYWIRAGKHSMNRDDWQVFLDFADKHLKAK
ncbi:MAG: acetylxylan esterase [Planctomycetes bacterium]|nr:acetylxylan esterase [Planctomycetota bacterium]